MLDSRMGIDFMERKTTKQIAISWCQSDVETILSPTQENFIKNYHKPRDKWPPKELKVNGKKLSVHKVVVLNLTFLLHLWSNSI